MKFVIRTLVFHILSIFVFAFLYYYFRDNYVHDKEEITFTDTLLLSTTIQATVGISNIYPETFYGKLIMIMQQLLLIMTHVITLYVFTI